MDGFQGRVSLASADVDVCQCYGRIPSSRYNVGSLRR
jgi:hypothetical protein